MGSSSVVVGPGQTLFPLFVTYALAGPGRFLIRPGRLSYSTWSSFPIITDWTPGHLSYDVLCR